MCTGSAIGGKMAKSIHLGRNLDLPISAVTQTFALLAKRGGGKTYCGLKLAEGMLEAHAQIVAIDPIGKWWSLRLAADGKARRASRSRCSVATTAATYQPRFDEIFMLTSAYPGGTRQPPSPG